MKTLIPLILASSLLAGGFQANTARAQSGTWTSPSGGSWANSANWLGGNIAQGPDATADFSTLNLPADAIVTLDGAQTIGNVIFGDGSGAHNWFLNTGSGDPLTLSVASVIGPSITVNNQTATIGLALAGTQGLSQNGNGTLVLLQPVGYTGGTTNNAGTLVLNGTLNTYKATPLAINGGVVEFAGTLRLNENQSGSSASADVVGAGTLKLVATTNSSASPDLMFGADHSGTSYYGAKATVSTLDLGGSQRYIYAWSSHNSVARYRNNEDARVNGGIVGAGGLTYIAQNNYGGSTPMECPLVLAGSNAFTGTLEIQRGSVYLLNPSALAQTNKLLLDPASGNNAKLFLYGSGAAVADLESRGPGSAYIANGNAHNNVAAIPASTLTVLQTSNTVFGGFIVDTNYEYDAGSYTAGPLGLIKNGPGTLTLTASNNYSGPTLVNAGTLVISVQGGGGSFTVADGAGLGVNVTTPVTTPMSALTLGNAGATALALTFSAAPSATAPAITTPNLTANGGANAILLTLAFNGPISVGQFPLIGYGPAGIGGSGFSAFKLGSLPSYLSAVLVNNTLNNSIDLKIAGVATPEWSGLLSSQWSTNKLASPKNWVFVTDGTTPTDYTDGIAVLFNDVATGTAVDISVANVAPGSVTFANNTKNFALTGSKGITGATALNLTGTGSVSINTSNGFTGPVNVSGGTLSINSDAALGAVPSVANPAAVIVNNAVLSASASLTLATNRGLALGPAGASGIGTLDVASGAVMTVPGPVGNNGAGVAILNKTGAGKLILAAANTYSSYTTNTQGTLTLLQNVSFARASVLSIATNAVVESGGTLNLVVDATSTILDVTGGGLLRLIATNNSAGSPDLYFGPNHSGNTDWGTRLATALDLGSAQRFIYGKTGHNGVGQYGLTGGDCQFGGPISGSGGLTFIAQNTYTGSPMMEVPFCLNASNSFTGPVELQRGSIYLGDPGAFPPGNVLRFNVDSGNNGRFFLYGNSITVSDLSATNAGTVVIADGNVNPDKVGPATLTVVQNHAATFTGTLTDVQAEYGGGGSLTPSLSLVKSGSATLTLDGPNSYSGDTTVSAGTLVLSPNGTLDTTPMITVAPGAALDISASAFTLAANVFQTLVAGRPSNFGPDIIGSLTTLGTIEVAGNGTAGTLTITGDLTLQGGSILMDLGSTATVGAGVNDLISVSGSLNLIGQTTIVPNFLTGGLGVGTYTLIKAAAINGDPNNLVMNLPGGGRQTYTLDATSVPGSVLLHVSGALPAALVWLGTNSSAWDQSTVDWLNGAHADRFYNGDTVTFNDSSTNGQVTVSGSVQPFSVLVNNSARPYTFAGAGSIDGISSLTKTGTGSLVILNSNTYSGLTLIESGTVQVDDGSTNAALGFGLVTNNATLAFDRSDVVNVTNIISGTGTLEQMGAGTLALLGANNYTGPTLITAGVLQIDAGGTTGVLGTGPVTNNAALVLDRSDATLTLSNSIHGSGTLSNLDGTVTLAGASSYGGGTWIEGGTLVAANNMALGSGPVTIDNGALYFNFPSGSTNVVTNSISLPGAGTQEFMVQGAPTTWTTVRLTGAITGGVGGQTFTLADTGVGGNHYDVVVLDNPSNTFLADILLWRGTLAFTSDAALGDPGNPVEIDLWNDNGSLRFDADNIILNANRMITIDSGGDECINVRGFTGTIDGVITGSGPFVKQGTGTLILNGANTYTSTTTISAGTLMVNGSVASTAGVTVSANTTLAGMGTVAGPVTVNGTVAPGANNVGTLTTAAQTWNSGGSLAFSLNTAVNSSGWSLLNITDSLSLGATAGAAFTIKLVSLTPSGAPGPLPDFNPASTYSWTITTTASGILNFDPAAFQVDTSAFANATHGTFTVTTNGNSLVLVYTGMAQPPAISGVQKLPDHNFSLTFTGPQGAHYSVHASTNAALHPVSSWPVIGTGTFSAGATTFDDLNATNFTRQFYLISTP